MEKRSKKKKVLLILLLLFVCLLIAGVLKMVFTERDSKWDDSLSQDTLEQIVYDGKRYSYNKDLTNILFMGIDNSAGIEDDNMPSDAGQSDCLMLLTLDKKKKEARILQIPRDTMTEVDIYNASGSKSSTVNAQIATQYAYCIGGKSSCFATKQTVSELLYDLPIDAYLAMDYTSIASVNDAIGGVEITVPKDYTMIDPAFAEGTTLTLKGKQAHDYVRWRDTNAHFSNNDRMQRQVQYVPAMIDKMKSNMDTQDDYYKVLYPLVEKYMLTNINEDQFKGLADYELITSDIQFLPGEGKQGEIYEEFHVDGKKLQKMLIEMFYILEE